MPDIHKWFDISDQFNEGLLLGNGASIAIHEGFRYDSLYEAAQKNGHLSGDAIDIFKAFEATDFEFVLRRLWHAKLVNQALGIESGRVGEAYWEVRKALITTVRDCHVLYDDASPHLVSLYRFMKPFSTVLSLNYDLIVYWAMMAGNQELGNWFKDAFYRSAFREDWSTVREPYGGAEGSTLVFYPHGNLILARNPEGEEIKLNVGHAPDLLNSILAMWEDGDVAPLFVSEGTTEKKHRAIEGSSYLHRVFREVISDIGSSLVVYGWSLSKQDKHILDQLRKAGIKKVAISVYGDDEVYMARMAQSFIDIGVKEVIFFDAESPGCWLHPED